MKLYAYRYCPFSRRVRIALGEQDVPYEYVELEPTAPHPPELHGKTPSPQGVPVLMLRDDFVLWDSTAIIQWIDSAYPRSLTPSQREPAALARSWEGWAVSRLFPHAQDAQYVSANEREEIVELLAGIEGMASGEWLVENEFSIADLTLGPIVGVLDEHAVASLPPNVRAYVGRLRSRPTIREVCELDLPLERPSFAA